MDLGRTVRPTPSRVAVPTAICSHPSELPWSEGMDQDPHRIRSLISFVIRGIPRVQPWFLKPLALIDSIVPKPKEIFAQTKHLRCPFNTGFTQERASSEVAPSILYLHIMALLLKYISRLQRMPIQRPLNSMRTIRFASSPCQRYLGREVQWSVSPTTQSKSSILS